jgi:anaerobic ribonucleoside-triphosphate reductase activating protein
MQLIIRELGHSYINGFSLLGGEPLAKYNIKDCENILALVKSHFPYKTVWVYSGYRFEEVRKLHIMKYIDVLVDGRFKESKKDLKLRFKGSSNQRVIDVQESLRKSKLILMESYNGY